MVYFIRNVGYVAPETLIAVSTSLCGAVSSSMVRVPASVGVHQVGNDREPAEQNLADAEGPSRTLRLDQDFLMDKFEVSNQRFSRFVDCTGHKTDVSFFTETFLFNFIVFKFFTL